MEGALWSITSDARRTELMRSRCWTASSSSTSRAQLDRRWALSASPDLGLAAADADGGRRRDRLRRRRRDAGAAAPLRDVAARAQLPQRLRGTSPRRGRGRTYIVHVRPLRPSSLRSDWHRGPRRGAAAVAVSPHAPQRHGRLSPVRARCAPPAAARSDDGGVEQPVHVRVAQLSSGSCPDRRAGGGPRRRGARDRADAARARRRPRPADVSRRVPPRSADRCRRAGEPGAAPVRAPGRRSRRSPGRSPSS